jgi:branched-chain amino acid transport system ATP-binding protein
LVKANWHNVMLKVSGLHVNYGALTALRDVSFEVARGEIVCLVGANGAGKSTALNAIAGGVVPKSGSINFEGRELVKMRPEAVARLGITLVPEGRHVFGTLTVEENLRVGARGGRRATLIDIDRVMAHFPILRERRRASAASLSGGEQQMLVLARALMTRPRLVMIDEPSLGLAPRIVDQVYEILLTLRRETGLTLLINEQSLQRVMKAADRLYVVRAGRVCFEKGGQTEEDRPAILEAYFGFKQERAPLRESA